MTKEQGYDTIKSALNEFIGSAASNPPESFAGAYAAMCEKVSGTIESVDGPLDDQLPSLP